MLSGRNIHKIYVQGARELRILKGISLEVAEGDDVCISGSSGAGKSTLLHILGTLDRPTEGQLIFRGEDVFSKSDTQLAHFRNKTMGFVFQFHHLLSEFSAIENVMMPGRIARWSNVEAQSKARQLLEELGLGARLNHYPTELSGGEQQRVAIARALITSPQILLADEPTGNLDSTNAKIIQDLFFDLKKQRGLTLIVVTHDQHFASRFTRRLVMADGLWATPGTGW